MSFSEYYKKWKEDNNITEEKQYNPNTTQADIDSTVDDVANRKIETITNRLQQIRNNNNTQNQEQSIWNRVQDTKNGMSFNLSQNTQNEIQQKLAQFKNQGATVNQNGKSITQRETTNKLKLPEVQIANKQYEEQKNNKQIESAEKLINDFKAQKTAEEINENIQKGGADAVNATIENTLNNFSEGVLGAVSGIANVPIMLGAGALDVVEKIIPNASGDIKNNLLNEANRIGNKFTKYTNANPYIENDAVKTTGSVANTIGNMIPSIVSNIIVPGSGVFVQGASAGGKTAQESVNADRDNIGQAITKGIGYGTASGLIEKLTGGNILGKGSLDDFATNFIGNKISSKLGQKIASKGYEFLGENLEEFLENQVDHAIDYAIEGKGVTKEEWINEFNETNKNTLLTTAVLNLLGLGGNTYQEIQNNPNIDQNTKQAVKEVNEAIDKNKLGGKEQLEQFINNKIDNNTAELQQQSTQSEQILPTQQITQEQNNVAQNENMEQIDNRRIATEEINNSRISTQEKQQMIEALNSIEEVSNEDINAIRNVINESNKLNELPTNQNFKDNQEARRKYAKYKNDNSDYDSTAVNEVLDIIPTNRNGRRTVKQWLQVADEIGTRIADKTDAEIEKIAYRSWFEEQPTKNITRYDNQAKTNVGFQKLTSDEWINTINNAVNKARENSQQNIPIQQINQEQNKVEQILPKKENILPVQENNIENNNKDKTKVNQEVLDYIKKNNINMTADEFTEWASNKQLEQENITDAKQKELYNLINDIQSSKNGQEGIVYHNIVNENGKIVDKTTGKVYNINDDLIPYISADEEKLKYIPYSQLEEYYQNDVETMDIIANKCSSEANKRFEQGKKSGKIMHDGKEYSFEVTDDNTFKIKEIRKPKTISTEVADERNINKNSRYSVSDERHRQRQSSNDIRQVGQQTTSTEVPGLGNKKSGQADRLYGNDRNSRTDVENSNKGSFSIVDNQGRQLSKQQQEFFKDSKVRNDKGELLEVYHGTKTDGINIFKYNSNKQTGTDYGKAFYFTSDYTKAQGYQYDIENDPLYKEYDRKDTEYKNWVFKEGISEDERSNRIKEWSKWHENNNVFDILNNEEFTPERMPKGETKKVYLNLTNPYIANANGEYYSKVYEKYFKEARKNGNDGIIVKNVIDVARGEHRPIDVYIAFNENQIKNIDNKAPTDNPDIRYELEDHSDNTAENEIQRKINRSMTMQEAKDMIQRAFVTGNIEEWYDGKYKNGDEWIKGEGIDDVAMWIDNDYNLQNKYINSNEDILNEEYMIEDVLEAYQNGTLTGNSDKLTRRLDTSKNTNYKDDRFYAPKDIQGGKELYEIANQRVTNANRQEVYKARADFILNAHNEGYVESLGLTQKEVNEKLRNWANYPKKAIETSKFINKGVAVENKWVGIENSSIVNELSVSQKQLDSLVKEIKGTTNEWQRRYIANTMLAIDTHMDYTGLTYDFAPDVKNMGEKALADYYAGTDTIRVRREGQNTIAHETGHFIDHLLGRKIGDGYNLGITKLCRSNYENALNGRTYTQEQKQFLNNFNNFLNSIEDVSDIGSKYKMDSQEVFARFVARFTEWTRNTATNGRYGYEASWYKDNFTTAQYMEFAKLLQEYSKLETTGQVSSKKDKTKGNKFDQRIEDIYSELFNNQKQILPTKETSNEASINVPTKGETINWNEMERPEGKIRKHYRSIIESSNTTAEAKAIAKEMMGTDTYIPESNNSQIERADKYIENNGVEKALERLREHIENDEITYDNKGLLGSLTHKKVSVDDIALGERLIQYYSKIGDRSNLQDAIHYTAIMGTEAGRAVQVMSLLNHMTPQGQLVWLDRSITKMNNELQQRYGNKENTPQFELTSEMTDKLLNTKSKEEMYKVLDDVYEELGQQVPKTTLEKIDEWRYFSMLANVKTHGRNMIGNVAMNLTQRAKNKVAGAIEGTVAKFNPEMERTHTIVPTSKKVKEFAKNDVKNMDVQTELGMNENKYNPQSRLQSARRTFKSDVLENTLGKMFDLNSKLLEVEDNIGLKSMYVNALGEYITANKLDIDNMTDAQLSKARQHAIKEAQEATFHQASALATALNQMGRKNNIAKFALDSAIPFKKTPINVAKTGVQYSPVGLIKSAVYDVGKLRKGDITVNQYIDNVSKGLTGTGIAYLGYALAQAGILKASGGDDDKKEKYDEEQGKQTYSIEIGGKTYSLDWLSPVGIPLFIGAEINQQFNTKKKEKNSKSNDDDEFLSQAIQSVANIANASANAMNPMSEMSMLSGLTSILSSYNKENAIGDMFVNAGKSYVNQFVPTALGQLARTTDDYERTTKSTKTGTLEKAVDSTINQIKSKIPGLRQTLPTKTDIWGKDIKQDANLPFRAFNNFINPSKVQDVSTDKVDKELNSLYAKTGENSIIPKAIDKTFTIDNTNYRMTNEEYAKYYKEYGKTSYNLIKELINTSDYKSLTDEQKQKAIENVYSYAKETNKLDYAKNNKINVNESTLYKTMNELKDKGGKQSSYINYMASTSGMTKENEKNEVLLNSNYDSKTKSVIYSNGTGKDDNLYNNIKNSNIDINEYLKYKTQDSNGKFSADKDSNGKSISGTAKEKIYNYVNSNITGYNNKLLILGSKYKLSRSEQEKLANYIYQISTSVEDKNNLFDYYSKNFTINNGKVYYK